MTPGLTYTPQPIRADLSGAAPGCFVPVASQRPTESQGAGRSVRPPRRTPPEWLEYEGNTLGIKGTAHPELKPFSTHRCMDRGSGDITM